MAEKWSQLLTDKLSNKNRVSSKLQQSLSVGVCFWRILLKKSPVEAQGVR
jgi:hypothetical protein